MRNLTRNLLATTVVVLLAAVAGGPVGAAFQPAPPVDQDARHGTTAADFSGDLATDAAGNVYQIIGTDGTFPDETSAGGRDVAVAKFAPDGAHLWTTQLGTSGSDNDGGEIAVTASGIVGVSGFTTGAFPGFTHLGGFYDAFFVILDADGNVTFTDQFGTSAWDEGSGVDTDGASFYVSGYTDGTLAGQTSAGGRDSFVRRYDLDGTVTGEVQFGTSGSDSASAVAVAPDGTVFATGFTTGAFSPSVGMNDGFVVKLDANLAFVAGANHGTTANDNYRGIDVGAGGDVVVSGSTFGAIPGQTAQGWDIVVQGIDATDLSSQWIRQFGVTSNTDNGWDVTVAADGTSYTACTTYGLEDLGAVGNEHGCVIVLDTLGSDLWNDQFIATGATLAVKGSALDPDGGVWLAGDSAGTFGGSPIGDQDAIRRKYEPFAGNVTEITACGFVADAPGDYRLANDVAGGGVCIDVTADDVVLDLDGKRLTTQGGGTGIRVTGARAQVLNQSGVASAELAVESGTAIDAANSDGFVLDGGPLATEVVFLPGTSASRGLALPSSATPTVRNLSVDAQGTGNLALDFDLSNGAVLEDTSVTSVNEVRELLSVVDAAQFTIRNVTMTNVSFEHVGLDLIVDGLELSLPDADGGSPPVRFSGTGTVEGFVQDGGSLSIEGRPDELFTWIQLDVRMSLTYDIGDGVQLTSPTFRRTAPGGIVRLTGVNGTSNFEDALWIKNAGDDVGFLVEGDPGATATFTTGITVDTLDPATESSLGQTLYANDSWTLGELTANVGFRYDHVAESPASIENTADEIDFRTFGMSAGPKEVRVGGVLQAGCVNQLDGTTTTCPGGSATDRTYVFSHETASGCGTHSTGGVVIYQDTDLDGTAGTTCVDLQAGVTWECDGHELRLPPGAPGAETVGFVLGAPGISIENCLIRLGGADTVGTSVESDDAMLRNLRFEHQDASTLAVRASLTDGLRVFDDEHFASGPSGNRTAYDVDNVTGLDIRGSTANDRKAYIVRSTNSVGVVAESIWLGEVDLSGVDGNNRYVIRDGTVDGIIEIGDAAEGETTTYIPANAEAIRNLATVFGPSFTDALFLVDPDRAVGILEENLATGVEFGGAVRFRSREQFGTVFGEIEFDVAPGTSETGITDPWTVFDRDSARIGSDLASEASFDLTFSQLLTPDDTTGVKIILGGSGDDAVANGACVTISIAGEPWAFRCARDLGQGTVADQETHVQFCGDGIRNEQVPGDACDPGGAGTAGKCQSDCTIVPAPGALQTTLDPDAVDPDAVVLTWNDTGEGPYEIYRSTDPTNVTALPENKLGLTSGTTWTDAPPPGGSYYYTVIPAP
jgi:hypothetical protein